MRFTGIPYSHLDREHGIDLAEKEGVSGRSGIGHQASQSVPGLRAQPNRSARPSSVRALVRQSQRADLWKGYKQRAGRVEGQSQAIIR